jgi:hypothetical protein
VSATYAEMVSTVAASLVAAQLQRQKVTSRDYDDIAKQAVQLAHRIVSQALDLNPESADE